MTDRIQKMRRFFVEEKRHHALRQPAREAEPLCESFARSGMPPLARAQRRVHAIIDNELPVVFPDERFVLMRTVQETPCLFTEAEYRTLRAAHWIHESGDFNNFCPDYGAVLARAFPAFGGSWTHPVRRTPKTRRRSLFWTPSRI